MTQPGHSSEDPGLQAPSGPVLTAMDPALRPSPLRIALQSLGLLIGLALFGWALVLAFGESNREAVQRLLGASPRWFAALIALSILSLLLNGIMFRVVLAPLRRLPVIDVVIVNAMATFLSVLPFKLGLLTRVLIHHRRDGVPFRDILSWMAAMGALTLAVLLPLGLVSVWRGALDPIWWAAAIGGVIVCSGVGVLLGRLSDRWTLLRRLSLGSHAVVRHWSPVLAHALVRMIDVGVLAGRFAVAAWIVGHAMTPDMAVLIATTYFLLSVLAPAGTLGFREMGVAAVGLASRDGEAALALVALVVSACEVGSAGALALLGWARIRPDRLLLRRGSASP